MDSILEKSFDSSRALLFGLLVNVYFLQEQKKVVHYLNFAAVFPPKKSMNM
jgi:hypothetical protein